MVEGVLWRPFFPPVPIVVGAAALAALALWVCTRTFRQAPLSSALALALRLGLIGAVAALLLGPSGLPEPATLPDRPRVTFLIDTSASMQTPDVASRSRYDFATQTWLSASRLARLRRSYDVEVQAFDAAARPVSAGELYRPAADVAVAGTSNVVASVGAAVADLPARGAAGSAGSAVVVLSDGRDTADAPPAAATLLAGSRGVAVHTVSLGGPNLRRDVAVVAVPLQEYLLAGEEGRIAVRVIGSGAEGAATTLRLRGPGGETTHPVSFEGENAVRFSLPVKHDEPGVYEYEVVVDALPGEVESRNNAQPVFIEVTKQRLAVLLLEGSPYWDTKFLAQSLRKDDRIELTQIVQLSGQRQQKLVSRVDASAEASTRAAATMARPVPQTLAEMRRYDVIVLGGGMEHVLTPQAARLLASYVTEHGGRLVFARGRCYDPGSDAGQRLARELAPLEPVVWGSGTVRDVRLTLDAYGESHPALALGPSVDERRRMVSDLPSLAAAVEVTHVKAATRVLARATDAVRGDGGGGGDGQPLLVTMPSGRGMVFAVLGEGLWRWSLIGRERKDLAGVFDLFWSNGVRWLAMGGDFQPGRSLDVRLSQRSVQVGETLLVDVSDRDAIGSEPRPVSLTVIGPDGERQQPAMELLSATASGRRRATLRPETPGVYRVLADAGGLEKPVESSFNAYELDLERLESSANPRLMRLLAEETGGQVLDPLDPDALERLLDRQRQAAVVPPRPRYLWNRGWIMVTMLTWGGVEWLVRKKGGLL